MEKSIPSRVLSTSSSWGHELVDSPIPSRDAAILAEVVDAEGIRVIAFGAPTEDGAQLGV